MTQRYFLVLALLAATQQAIGSFNTITDWFKNIGIEYVPPSPRPATCRDCNANKVKDKMVGLKFIYIYIYISEGRFGLDITPTQQTGPCCNTNTVASGSFKCGLEGAPSNRPRIVGGVPSMVSHTSPTAIIILFERKHNFFSI